MTTSDPSVRASLLGTIKGAGAYDLAATVNAALLRYPTDRVRATDDLAAAMAAVPTLIYSDRPDPLFDEAVWSAARTKALQQITLLDPTLGAALATLAGEEATAAGAEAGVSDPADRAALAMLQAATTDGSFDLGAAKGLLRDHASSPSVQGVLWLLGFRATSQPLIDAVTAVSVPAFFGVPLAPMELVTDGGNHADYSVQLPRGPVAETSRQGPKRPYVPGF